MEQLAAIVDGHAEARFFERSANAFVLRSINNGRDVPLEHIEADIAESLQILPYRIKNILIVFDREQREQSAASIVQQIAASVAPLLGDRAAAIGVKDIQIENWLLADEKRVSELFKQDDYRYVLESKPGKPELRRLLGYSPSPVDIADMLKSSAPSRIRTTSDSFNLFHAQCKCDWWWLKT